MGSPGRRRRAGRQHWLQTLIDRAPGGRSRRTEDALARLLAEPAEDDWPDHSDAERQLDDSADGWPADPAAYQWLGGWTDEPAPRRLLDGAPDLGWSAGAAARRRRASRPSRLGRISQRDWYLTLARYRWYVAVSAGAGAMALASGVILLLPHHPARAVMADATTAPQVTGTRPASTAPRQAAASPGPDVRAQPATPASTAPGFVAVTYRLVEHWSGGIIGKYTIANEGNAVLSGWRFSATFPGDQVQFVIGAADPDLGSDLLVLEPASAGAQLAPGAKISVIFFAAGPTGSPVTCSFNGRAC